MTTPAENNTDKTKTGKDERVEQAKKKEKKQPVKPREYNPRAKGYILICLSSLVNLSAISNVVQENRDYDGIWGLCVTFGWLTFSASLLILFFDRTQYCLDTFNYTKAYDGKFEGYALLFFTLWWIFGVSYITQVNGVAFLAMNIYFSSWSTLASCVYTLNKWSTAKDILSIAELTGVSATLKSWYVLSIASLFTMGTAFDLFFRLQDAHNLKSSSAMGFAMGIASSIISFMFILVHYNFIQCFTEGGWIELSFAFLLILLWIVGVAVLTQDDGVAATIMGVGCPGADWLESESGLIDTCTIAFTTESGEEKTFPCGTYSDLRYSEIFVPGSNLYLATWICLGASLNIAFRWKAAQALQFAQAQNQKVMTTTHLDGDNAESDDDLDGNDDDLDEFEDAVF
jgi:hypothetical protein